MNNILEALNKSKAKYQGLHKDYDKQERVMIDGSLSICDEVFECELWKLGIDNETISWRLKEPVETREEVIKMYERGIR